MTTLASPETGLSSRHVAHGWIARGGRRCRTSFASSSSRSLGLQNCARRSRRRLWAYSPQRVPSPSCGDPC